MKRIRPKEWLDVGNHPFTCSDCGSKFAAENEFMIHCISVHKMSKCSYCKSMIKAENRCAHILLNHPTCTLCVLKFVSESVLIEHYISVHKMSKCSYGTCLINPVNLSIHNIQNHPITCSLCGSQFSSKIALLEHMDQKHQVIVTRRASQFVAGQSLSVPKMANGPTLSVSEKMKCPHCNCSIEAETFIAHKLEHHTFICSDCGLEFAFKTELNKHYLSVHKMAKCYMYNCNALIKNDALVTHMAEKHTFICSVCGSRFPFENELNEHSISVHKTSLPDYKISKCSYSKVDALSAHMIQNQPLRCSHSLCDSKFASASALIDHMKENHPCICSLCGSKFAWENELIEHLMSIHKFIIENHPACALCGNQFASKNALLGHMKQKHLLFLSGRCSVTAGKRNFILDNECPFIAETVELDRKHSSIEPTAAIIKEEPEASMLPLSTGSDNKREPSAKIKHEDGDFEIERHRNMLSKICRLCGSRTDDEYKTSDYFAEISALTESDISKDIPDVHPQKLCEICKDNLKETETFCAVEFKPHSDFCSICQ